MSLDTLHDGKEPNQVAALDKKSSRCQPTRRRQDKPRCSRKLEVSFDRIEVLEFAQTLGDNPSCRQGPPVALSSYCIDCYSLDLDEFEYFRDFRRTHKELRVSSDERRNVLHHLYGHPLAEIKAVETEVTELRKSVERSRRRYQRHLWWKSLLPRRRNRRASKQ